MPAHIDHHIPHHVHIFPIGTWERGEGGWVGGWVREGVRMGVDGVRVCVDGKRGCVCEGVC